MVDLRKIIPSLLKTISNLDELNRQEAFQTAIQEFTNHSTTLIQTARLAANGTSCRSKSTIETINITASQVCLSCILRKYFTFVLFFSVID